MSQNLDNLGVHFDLCNTAVCAGLAVLGVGSIITAIISPKWPLLKDVNSKALIALRVAMGVAGGAGTVVGLTGLGYSILGRKNSSQRRYEEEAGDSGERGEVDELPVGPNHVSSAGQDPASSEEPLSQGKSDSESEDMFSRDVIGGLGDAGQQSGVSSSASQNSVAPREFLSHKDSDSESEDVIPRDVIQPRSPVSGSEKISAGPNLDTAAQQEAFVKAVMVGDRSEADARCGGR